MATQNAGPLHGCPYDSRIVSAREMREGDPWYVYHLLTTEAGTVYRTEAYGLDWDMTELVRHINATWFGRPMPVA